MGKLHIVFSHGKESGPWGSKIKTLAEHVQSICECKIHSIDYKDLISPEDRVERLVSHIENLEGEIILIGSSMGGYVSSVASSKIKVSSLMLLAPALYLDGYDVSKFKPKCNNISIIHGWNDGVVPYQNSVKFAQQHKAKLVLVYDGHRLQGSALVLNNEIEILINKLRKAQ